MKSEGQHVWPLVIDGLTKLETLRDSHVIVYCCGGDGVSVPKSLRDEDVPILYECLRTLGQSNRLDLVLHTNGGFASTARRIALLLHEYAQEVRILVPYKARSAGTLLCLAAHQIVLGPLAELSPLDPNIGSVGDSPSGAPPIISAEDVRAYRQMAEDWFGLHNDEQRMQIFTLLSQRFFPTSLSSFYRADRHVRQLAEELLHYQLPESDTATRQRIVDHLVSGYHAHDYSITCAEAQQLGLRAQATSTQEEGLIWEIWQACRQTMRNSSAERERGSMHTTTNGIIASNGFAARYVLRWVEGSSGQTPGSRPPPTSTLESGWELL